MKVGDKVIVVNKGSQYSSYDLMYKKMGLTNNPRWRASDGEQGRVVAMEVHPTFKEDTIVGVELSCGRHLCMEKRGLKLLDEGFSVGDAVEVVDSGKQYRAYDEMFELMGLTKALKYNVSEGDKGKVIAIENHLDYNGKILLGVQMANGRQFCINALGVKRIETRKKGLGNNPQSINGYAAENKSIKTIKEMEIVKTKKIEVNGVEREVTLAILNEGKFLRAGYSVRMPDDKPIEGLSRKIAVGRAMNPRTNLIDMELGRGMDKKYILHSVLESLFKQIERGVIKIKGVK